MKMFVRGQWKDKHEKIDVTNPFDGAVIDTVPRGDADDVSEVLTGAVQGAAVMRKLPAYDRSKILRKAADLLAEAHRRREEADKLEAAAYVLLGDTPSINGHAVAPSEITPDKTRREQLADFLRQLLK